MKFTEDLEKLAQALESRLACYESKELSEWPWRNTAWASNDFAWAHLQRYCTDKVSILHLVIMPCKNSSAPIFGFDLIEISNTLTGMFLDLTPVTDQVIDFQDQAIGEPRPIPDWANFFGPNFVCVRPRSIDEAYIAVKALNLYMTLLPAIGTVDYSNQQQNYINGQRQNPQTRRMLASHIGMEPAKKFIEQVLFPNIN